MDPPESSHVRNPYDVLGVSPDASPDEIRDAYWRLVRFYRAEGETAWTATHLGELQDAYELLSDPSRRAELDAGNGGARAQSSSRSPTSPAPRPPPAEPVVRHHSHNPVDRLTRACRDRGGSRSTGSSRSSARSRSCSRSRPGSSTRTGSRHLRWSRPCIARAGPAARRGFSDRVLANRFIYHFRNPHRGEIVVFKTPPAAQARCGAGGTFVKRLIGLPGDRWSERNGYVYIDGKRLNEPYIKADRRDSETHGVDRPEGDVLHDGRQPLVRRAIRASGGRCHGGT